MKSKKVFSLLLAVLLMAGTFVFPANAMEAGSAGSCTESFTDEATGRELAGVQVSKSQWTKEAPEIAGYEYAEFSQKTEHTSDYSFGYVAGWSRDKALPELKASLDVIRATAAGMIDVISPQKEIALPEKKAQKIYTR